MTAKAIELNKKIIVVVNKVDKPNCRPDEAQEAVFELMFNLGATEDQLEFETKTSRIIKLEEQLYEVEDTIKKLTQPIRPA